MKKFKFSLERMLDYQESLKEKERNALMYLYARRNELEDKLVSCRLQFAETNCKLKQKTMEGTTVPELQLINLDLQTLRGMEKQLLADLALLAGEIEAQRLVVLHLSQQVSGLDKLKDKQLDEYNYLLRKSEEERISEMVSQRFISGQ